MPELSQEERNKIADALARVGAKLPCPRCGNEKFTVMEGYFNHSVQMEFTGIVIGGPSVPSAVVVCVRCGFIAQHALGVLGLLSKPTPPRDEGRPQ